MAATSRYGSAAMLLSRMTVSSVLGSSRTFSTAVALRNSSSRSRQPQTDAPSPRVRSNPLVGNYVPPKPFQLKLGEEPPVSTEHPRSPRPPMSSAEVPPNADMPPPSSMAPPPPPPPPAAEFEQKPAAEDSIVSTLFPYDAAKETPADTTPATPTTSSAAPKDKAYQPIDIASIIGTAATNYTDKVRVTDPTKQHHIRTAPVVGRTVFLRPRMGPNSAPTPTSAFRVLNRICSAEKVRNKFHTQKFHERKGLKRKRLRSERWRARFKAGFSTTVSRVMELKRQGW